MKFFKKILAMMFLVCFCTVCGNIMLPVKKAKAISEPYYVEKTVYTYCDKNGKVKNVEVKYTNGYTSDPTSNSFQSVSCKLNQYGEVSNEKGETTKIATYLFTIYNRY